MDENVVDDGEKIFGAMAVQIIPFSLENAWCLCGVVFWWVIGCGILWDVWWWGEVYLLYNLIEAEESVNWLPQNTLVCQPFFFSIFCHRSGEAVREWTSSSVSLVQRAHTRSIDQFVSWRHHSTKTLDVGWISVVKQEN